jgi:DNA (cytosine-5)-methyltransferase 1
MKMLKAIDLFSGIGCFSLAFHNTFRTVAYCEIDERCRRVLKKNMERGYIHRARVFKDVCKMHIPDHMAPDVLMAGFPCQDMSQANRFGKGLDGNRSGLFFEIIRILRETPSIDHVLLENVPAVLNYPDIIEELEALGYIVKHTIISAAQVGAPHLRRRAFICASRAIEKLPDVSPAANHWLGNKRPVLAVERRADANPRNSACGNAIVPQWIVAAYRHVVRGHPVPNRVRYIKNVLVDGDTVVEKRRFSTPNASFLNPYRQLSRRAVRVLCNDVKFNTNNPHRLNYDGFVMNPNFSEWLMGLPRDYTSLR